LKLLDAPMSSFIGGSVDFGHEKEIEMTFA